MATTYLRADSAPVIHPQHFPPAAAGRIAASLLNRHSPHEIAEAIEVLVDVLDLIGGDSDEEANGDELDGTNGEDEELGGAGGAGPGCQISDPDSAVDDRPCDDIDMDLEPDCDAEIETWSHPDDHPAELFVGRRPAEVQP